MRRLFGGQGYAGTATTAAVEFAWMGAVSDDGITVKARATAGTPVLVYSTDPDLIDTSSQSGTQGNDGVWTFTLSGLDADTTYYWSIVGWGSSGRFTTLPTAASQASFTIAAASCAGSTPGNSQADYDGAGQTSNTPTWARIEDRLPLLFLNFGDWGYPDITSGSTGDYWQNYRDNAANARQASLWRKVPFSYCASDHDYSDNDSDGTYAGKAAFATAYRDYVPSYTLPDSGATYHTFAIGRVRFFMLDVHYYRSPNAATDNSSKTMLGATQKQWLKDELSAATEKVLVIGINTPWIAGEAAAPTWAQFTTEREEIADYIIAEGLEENVLLVGGDHHFICGDDGTNAEGGLPSVGFAPMDSTFSTETGTHSEGVITDSKQQYGTIEFTDAGSTITARMQGWAVTDGTEAEVLDFSVVFDAT